jgi:FAD binding domain
MPADPFITENDNINWVNHHKNVNIGIAKSLSVRNETVGPPKMSGMRATAARIQGIIRRAKAEATNLRACGSRWSFSDIPVVLGGWVLETSQIDWRFFPSFDDLDPATRFGQEELILAQCGAKISTLNKDLENKARGRALRTSGASNGQTIGGSIGTGIHGSAIDVGGLESQVAGIQLLTADDNIWIERASAPAMNAAFAAKLGARLERNDQLFEAAIVSLGALGIVHSVLLRSTGRYKLHSALAHIPLGQLAHAMNTLDFAGSGIPNPFGARPYFFQVILDPHRADIGYTMVRYRTDCEPDFVPSYDQHTQTEPGTDVPRLIGSAIQMFPGARDIAVSLLMKDQLRVREDTPAERATPGQVYTFTLAREGIASCGFAVPIGLTGRAIELAREAFAVHRSAPVVFTCRYGQRSPGTLSFVRFDPSCVIDIDGIDTPATHLLMKLACDKFDAAGIPYTMHWGKTNHLTNARVRSGYGGAVDKWNAARRTLLPDPVERNLFSSPFIDAVGLNA